MILLSDHAIKTADGGQSLIGGLDAHVCRNFFGSQIYSTTVVVKPSSAGIGLEGCEQQSSSFPAVFIRAPAMLRVGPQVQVLATMSALPHRAARRDVLRLLEQDPEALVKGPGESGLTKREEDLNERFDVIIAVRQGNILATAFHPELTNDLRWHKLLLDMIITKKKC
jgi:5'-phosphate synthase pdxT subunit